MRELVEPIAAVVAPATVLSGLFVYFGYLRTSTFYNYFGIAPGHLQLSTQEYVLRSGDVGAGVLVRLVGVGAALLLLDRVVDRVVARLTDRRRRRPPGTRRPVGPVGLVYGAGAVAVLCGLVVAVDRRAFDAVGAPVGAALLAAGAIVLWRTGRSVGSGGRSRAVTAMLALVLVVSAFWATSIYAVAIGGAAARDIDVRPTQLALATVFSPDPLDLPGREVRVSRIPGPDGRFRYRYTGLRMLTYANGRWFMITGRLRDDYRPSVVVLYDAAPIRVELASLDER